MCMYYMFYMLLNFLHQERSVKLHEFIVRLLSNPDYNPSIIKWVNEEKGIFKLVNKNEIVKMWGMRGTKTKFIKYDHFARDIR